MSEALGTDSGAIVNAAAGSLSRPFTVSKPSDWIDAVKVDFKKRNVTIIQVRSIALDRNEYKKKVFGPPKISMESQRPL